MTIVVNLYLAAALFPWLFWALYVLVMGVYRAHLAKRLSVSAYTFGVPWVAIGYGVDILANLTFASVVFLDPPREWLVTDRFKRYIKDPAEYGAWRYHIALWVCTHLLDVFDPTGDHC